MKTMPDSKSVLLHIKAEEFLRNGMTGKALPLSDADTLKLVHELQIYQLELELQYEELEVAKNQLAEAASNRYAKLYDFAPIGFFTLSRAGEILELNLQASKMLGKERSGLINSSLALFVSDDSKPQFNFFLENVFRSYIRETCDLELSDKINPFRYVELSGIAIEKHEQCLVAMVDITERKKAETAIRESEIKYKTLFEDSSDAFFILNGDKFIECNQKTEAIFKSDKENIIGHTLLEFSPAVQPDGQLSTLKASEKLSSTLADKPQFFEWKHLRPDGSLFDAEVSLMRIVIKDVSLVQARVRDITERKHAETELGKSEERLREISKTDWVWEVNEKGVFTYTSQTGIDFLGLSCDDEIIGKTPYDFMAPDERERVSAIFAEITANKMPIRNLENWNIKKNGEKCCLLTSGVPILDENGDLKGYRGVDKDITDRKLIEAEIKKTNEELQKSNSEKDKFFSIIAHDLRGPIGNFMGLTERMAEGMKDMTLDQLLEITTVMKKSSSNLYSLLGNLLEWSRMQRGLTTFEPISFLLKPKIFEIIQSAIDVAANKEIAISSIIPDELEVFADENMLASVIRNLVDNAVKFTHKGGNINISAVSVPGNKIEISISDSGIGMNKEIMENLFNHNINTSRKGTAGELSTGLGLMICKDFIEMHGGIMTIESKAGEGSTFRFTLPVNSSL